MCWACLCVCRLNLLQLAPGGHLGRFVVWTQGAFEKLDTIYGTYTDKSQAKVRAGAGPVTTTAFAPLLALLAMVDSDPCASGWTSVLQSGLASLSVGLGSPPAPPSLRISRAH
jgi:hypothetical protein